MDVFHNERDETAVVKLMFCGLGKSDGWRVAQPLRSQASNCRSKAFQIAELQKNITIAGDHPSAPNQKSHEEPTYQPVIESVPQS
jgi:hypothetical protein